MTSTRRKVTRTIAIQIIDRLRLGLFCVGHLVDIAGYAGQIAAKRSGWLITRHHICHIWMIAVYFDSNFLLFYHHSYRWADITEAVGIDGQTRQFKHPFVQACTMFLGEMLCLLTFKVLYFLYKRRGVGHDIQIHTQTQPTTFYYHNIKQSYLMESCTLIWIEYVRDVCTAVYLYIYMCWTDAMQTNVGDYDMVPRGQCRW